MLQAKFRGLTKEGKLVYGDKVTIGKRCFIVSRPELSESDDIREKHCSIWGFIEVIPETVGQFTGLKDKKRTKEYPEGQEIYEGDIVKLAENTFGETELPINCVVKWNDKGFYQLWRNGMIHWKMWREDTYHHIEYRKNWEIIGNIHENPELLGEKINE